MILHKGDEEAVVVSEEPRRFGEGFQAGVSFRFPITSKTLPWD